MGCTSYVFLKLHEPFAFLVHPSHDGPVHPDNNKPAAKEERDSLGKVIASVPDLMILVALNNEDRIIESAVTLDCRFVTDFF
jgi:hypothetical protein